MATRLSQWDRDGSPELLRRCEASSKMPKGPGFSWTMAGLWGLLEMSHSREISHGSVTCLMDVRVLRIMMSGTLCILCSPFSGSRLRSSLVLLHGLWIHFLLHGQGRRYKEGEGVWRGFQSI